MDGPTLRRLRRDLRDEDGRPLSQARLGRLLGVSQQTIARWETGAIAMRHPLMLALALDALACRQKRQETQDDDDDD